MIEDSQFFMKVSVIIVAYRNGKVLKDSLDSLHQYNDLGSELEVIVVDNSPDDERILSFVKESSFRDVQYIPADNRGFGAGNNIGAQASSGEILCFMNPDIIYIEPVFGKAYQKFQEDPGLMLFGGKLLNSDLSPGFSFYYDYSSTLWHRSMDKIQNKRDHFISESMHTSGSNLFVRRDAFFAAGMFDENLFMYCEEGDLIRRIHQTIPNTKHCYFPELRMIHLERQSTPKGILSFKREIESSVYYGKKYGLDYRKKIRFERRYLKLKLPIYRLLKREGINEIEDSIDFLQTEYKDLL